MKSRFLLIFLTVLLCDCLYSQNEEAIIKEIQKDFDRFTPQTVINLVPFQDKATKKYGYIDAVSKQIAITAKYDYLYLFQYGDCIGVYKDVGFEADYTDDGLTIRIRPSLVGIGMVSIPPLKALEASDYNRVKDHDKGFVMSDTNYGEIEKYSHIYNEVYPPFVHNSKFYTIACIYNNKVNKYAVIDTEGNSPKGLGFDEDYIFLEQNMIAKSDGEKYFFAVNSNLDIMMVSTSGEKMMMGKHNTADFHRIRWDHFEKFGYVIHGNGLYDLINIKCLIEPEEGVKLLDIDYNYLHRSIDDYTPEYRYLDNILILVAAEEDGHTFYMGLDGYKYMP